MIFSLVYSGFNCVLKYVRYLMKLSVLVDGAKVQVNGVCVIKEIPPMTVFDIPLLEVSGSLSLLSTGVQHVLFLFQRFAEVSSMKTIGLSARRHSASSHTKVTLSICFSSGSFR